MARDRFVWGLGAAIVGVVGCDREELVTVTGTVFSSHETTSSALPGAALRFVDFDGQAVGSAKAGDDGTFRAEGLPGGISVLVEVAADDYATASFPGILGLDPVQEVEHRALYGVSLVELEAARARFAGCPGADDPEAAAVIGEIRLFGFTDPLTGGQPSTSVGYASVYVDGEPIAGCYLDDEGLAYDPEASLTGGSGAFAVFGVPPGLHELEVGAEVPGGVVNDEIYPVWVPEAGAIVSPWYPAPIELL